MTEHPGGHRPEADAPPAWATGSVRRSPSELAGSVTADLADLVAGLRHRRIPRSAARQPSPAPRTRRRCRCRCCCGVCTHPVRALRHALHLLAVKPLLNAQLQLDIGGQEHLDRYHGPLLIVANHASHLDTPVLLEALPSARRGQTAVAVAADYFADAGCRGAAAGLMFNTFTQEPATGRRWGSRGAVRRIGLSQRPEALLRASWNVVMFPEGSRSADGFVHEFSPQAAALAIEENVPVLPVGIRGTYAAMPRGRAWPGRLATSPLGRARRRVSVRFGPALTAQPDESAEDFTRRLATAVDELIAEDTGTWWQSELAARRPADSASVDRTPPPPAGSWRRIWEQSQSPQPGARPRRTKIWR